MSDVAAVMPHTKLQEPESIGNLARLKIGLSKGEGHVTSGYSTVVLVIVEVELKAAAVWPLLP
jgi:hypothetical protein